MEDRDLRRSPSLERLLKHRPSFSRPPIRTIYSPRLTEDEAEMLTSPFLSYRTKYTYAESSCYNPDLPCSWEVPNLAYAGAEINAHLSYIHVSSPSFFYILWSYILWIFEIVAYFVRKIVVTLFKDGPVSLLVLFYDIVRYLYYTCRTFFHNSVAFIQTFFFGNALHRGRSAVDIFKKSGYFLVSLLLLPASASHWLFQKIVEGFQFVRNKMSLRQYNLRSATRQHAVAREHVRFSPEVADIHNDDDDDETASNYSRSSRGRSTRPVHNLRSRMITEEVTDSEDEGYSERRPVMTSTPIRSALKTNNVRRKLDFDDTPPTSPASKAAKTAQFLGKGASTVVSGVYWVLIEILTFFNGCIYAYKHRIRNLFSSSDKARDAKTGHTRRSTRRRTSSKEEEIVDGRNQMPVHHDEQSWSSKFVTTVLYPLAVTYDVITSGLYWFMKVVLAVAFAIVDFLRLTKNLFVGGLYHLYDGIQLFVFGKQAADATDGENEIEEVAVLPYELLTEKARTVLWIPFVVFNWLGEKTMAGLSALGEKKRLILWLLPLLLILFILFHQQQEHPSALLKQNVEDVKDSIQGQAAQTWGLFFSTEKFAVIVKDSLAALQRLKNASVSFVTRGSRGVWNILSHLPSRTRNLIANTFQVTKDYISYTATLIWKTISGGPTAIWEGLVDAVDTLIVGAKYIASGVRRFFKSCVTFVWDVIKTILIWIYNQIMALWNVFVDFLVYLIDIWRSLSKKAVSYMPTKFSFPDTASIKSSAYEHYQSIPSLTMPTLISMPELPEIPIQFYPSYYREYIPSKESVSNVFWSVTTFPIVAIRHLISAPSIIEKVVDITTGPTGPHSGQETVKVIREVVYHPSPKAEIPKIDEAKIVQEVLAKLTLPSVDEAKVIREVAAKLAVPKVDEAKIIAEVTNKLKAEMDLRINALEQSYKKNIEDINIKHTNIEIDYSHLEGLIRKAIYQYDADKTGLFDFALESAGAAVISTRCSESYNSYSRLEKIWNIPLWYSSYGPRTVIQRNANSLFPGECWSFKSGQGYLTIDLSHKINITSISYEHIGADQAPDNNRSSAPKTFKFWAYKTEDDIRGRFLLGDFEYKLDGHPLQFFVIKRQPDFSVKIVEMEVTSNHGAEFTCLYRLRVHGQIYKNA